MTLSVVFNTLYSFEPAFVYTKPLRLRFFKAVGSILQLLFDFPGPWGLMVLFRKPLLYKSHLARRIKDFVQKIGVRKVVKAG